jgi:hypothetical protein
LALQTPPELQAYGWTTADLWCAPVTTGLYALLTHAQPFWADAHSVIGQLLGGGQGAKGVEPVDPEVARAVCAFLLATLFTGRTAKNFGLWKPLETAQAHADAAKQSLCCFGILFHEWALTAGYLETKTQ